jgi:hypothetical protein
MSTLECGSFVALIAFLLAAQIVATVVNRNVWPIAAQNMFSYTPTEPFPRVMAILYEAGEPTTIVFATQLLPVEFFRVPRILLNSLAEKATPAEADAFARQVLSRLNEQPWRAWDERDACAKPGHGRCFTDLDLISMDYSLDRYTPGMDLSEFRKASGLLYSSVVDLAERTE